MTPSSFFGTSLRRDPNQPADLNARIEAQLRERLEEAVDFVCLEALVKDYDKTAAGDGLRQVLAATDS